MVERTQIDNPHNRGRWRVAAWSVAAGILLIPLIAMLFTREVNWTVGDFLFAFLMIGGAGLAFELVVRSSSNRAYRAGAATALAASFLLVWINGAVGMIGSEENFYNVLFLGVIGVALMGAIIARFQAPGMVRAMSVAGLFHGAIAAVGMSIDFRGGLLSAALAGLWIASAALFHRAAHQQEPASD